MINMFDYDYEYECDCEKEKEKEFEKEREIEDKKKTMCNCRLFKTSLHFVIKTSLLALSAFGIVIILKKISSFDGGPDL